MSAQVWVEHACSVLVRSSSSSPALSAPDRPQPGMADMVRPGALKSQALSAGPALDSCMHRTRAEEYGSVVLLARHAN